MKELVLQLCFIDILKISPASSVDVEGFSLIFQYFTETTPSHHLLEVSTSRQASLITVSGTLILLFPNLELVKAAHA